MRQLKTASAATYIVVNLVFVMKYSLRLGTGVAWVACLAYVVGSGLLIALLSAGRAQRMAGGGGRLLAWSAVCMVILAALQLGLDPYQIQVDRWSAIHNFLDLMLRGEYPYLAQTHLGGYGSPFPVWQIVHLPFFLLGDVALSVFVVWGLLVYAVKTVAGNGAALRCLLLMAFSPAFVYEVAVRSDLVTNFMLVAVFVMLLLHHHATLQRHYWMMAVGCGLLMSTRITAVVPMGMAYMLEWWRLGYARRLMFPVVVVVVFALTFLPFVVWDMSDLLFFKYNPFVLQSRQSHAMDFILFIPLFVYWALAWTHQTDSRKAFRTLMGNTAAFLLTVVGVTFLHNMVISGNYNLFASAYDITYLDMALPFVVTSMAVSLR